MATQVVRRREGLEIGREVGSAVDFSHPLPFAFTGRSGQVTIDLRP